jgi:tetratricopeptide (TPR) repeat protein
VALVLGTAGGVYRQQQRQRAREQAREGLKQAAGLRDGYRYADAEAMLKQVRGWARQAADRELEAWLDRAAADLALAHDLDTVRQEAATVVEGKWGDAGKRTEYPEVLARHGLNVLEGDPDELAETIRASAIRESIFAALDDWAQAETDLQKSQRLLRLANRVDELDPWRQAVREAVAQRDERRLYHLARANREGKPTPGVVLLLAGTFQKENEEVTALLRRMQLEKPSDFWVSVTLGYRFHEQKKHQEAAECYLVAVALRPDSAMAHSDLGLALRDKGKVDEAVACFKRAIDIEPKLPHAHSNLGIAFRDKGKVDEAIESHHRAIAIDPKFAPAHYGLGNALRDKGKVDEAIECYQRAIAIDPKFAGPHNNLGVMLKDRGKVDEAISCYRRAIAIDPKHAQAHSNLGVAMKTKGKVNEAIACFKKAIDNDSKDALAHYNLGNALRDKDRVEQAIECYQTAIAIDPKYTMAHHALGVAFHSKGEVDNAITSFKKALIIDSRDAKTHYNLGVSLFSKGKVDDAIACFKGAIELDAEIAHFHGALGQALMQRAEFVEAEKALRRSLTLFPLGHPLRGPMLDLRRQCRQQLAADGKLKAFLAGKGASADAATQVQMADLAQQPFHRLSLTAARLYRDAFARQPRLADAHRYNAACAAALAGTGQGKDVVPLDDRQRTLWLKQALDWLRTDLAAHALKINGRLRGSANQSRKTLEHWIEDPDLAGVRDERSLAMLPEKEREQWRKLWADVAALIKKVEEK